MIMVWTTFFQKY